MRFAPSFKKLVLHRLIDMEEFKSFTLSSIENEKQSFSERVNKDTEHLSEEEKEEYFGSISQDYFMIEDVFTQISMRSFIVILFSYIEDGMNMICNVEYSAKAHYHKKEGLEEFQVKYTDMDGKGINRAKLYMEKIIGCNLHSDKKPWSEIQTLRKIRDAIVHVDGNADSNLKDDANFKQHIHYGRLKLENHNKIKIEPSYLDYILEKVREYFNEIDLKFT